MMIDISPQLLEKIEEEFGKRFYSDPKVKRIYAKIQIGTADYIDANKLSGYMGKHLAKAIETVYAEAGVSGLLPNDTLYRNIVDKTLAPMLREAHAEISAACSYIQTDLNKKAGLGIKAISPAIDEDKLSGLAYQVANTGEPRLRAREAGMVENFVQTAVDAYVQANIDFQKEAGLSPQITRMRGASPNPDCGFCEERVYSGEYKGPNMPEGIFMRHRHCHCIVLYDPKDGRGIQGAHSKQSYKNHQEAIVKEREYLGKLDSMSSSERKAARRAKARLQYQNKKTSVASQTTPAEKIAKAKAQLPDVMSPEKIAMRKELGTKPLAKKDPKVLMARAEAQNKNKIIIASPGSTKSFIRSLEDIVKGRAGLDKRRKNILSKLKKEGEYARFAKDSISERDIAYLSAATGDEFALFRSKKEDILIRGNRRQCVIDGEIAEEICSKKYELIIHSHVDKGKLTPSTDDRRLLRKLDQNKSRIIGIDGKTIEYFSDSFEII